MGSDFFCSVSGARYFIKPQEFREVIIDSWSDTVDHSEDTNSKGDDDLEVVGNLDDRQIGAQGLKQHHEDDTFTDFNFPKPAYISNAVWDGLLYSQEDVDSSSNFVLLCPYILFDGDVVLQAAFDCAGPDEITESNITQVFDVVPGDNPDLGDYGHKDYDGRFYSVLPYGTTLIIMYTSYLILKQASPRLKPHMIYDLAYHENPSCNGHVPGVDYGPVNGIQDQYAEWPGVSDVRGFDEQIKDWKFMLTKKGKTDEEILYDAWRGRGNMWVFVRPDRFPISETLSANPLLLVSGYSNQTNPHRSLTFDTLPLDILLLICQWLPVMSTHMVLCTNRRLRNQILPHANRLAYHYIVTYESHFLPAGPFVLKDDGHGREEVDWWNVEWVKGNLPIGELNVKIPWLLYRRECSKSLSMWNRRRIWGVAKQLESLAVKRGLLD